MSTDSGKCKNDDTKNWNAAAATERNHCATYVAYQQRKKPIAVVLGVIYETTGRTIYNKLGGG
jgi:hypothetical protein